MPVVPPFTQIDPRRIHGNYQLDFLNPKPAFDPLLAVNRSAHIVEALVVDESINLVALAELRSVPKFVFLNTPMQVICNSDVERLGALGQNVNAVVRVIAGMHRSFASLRMTGFRLCIEKMRKSVRGVHQNCDDSCLAIQSPCHLSETKDLRIFPRRTKGSTSPQLSPYTPPRAHSIPVPASSGREVATQRRALRGQDRSRPVCS